MILAIKIQKWCNGRNHRSPSRTSCSNVNMSRPHNSNGDDDASSYATSGVGNSTFHCASDHDNNTDSNENQNNNQHQQHHQQPSPPTNENSGGGGAAENNEHIPNKVDNVDDAVDQMKSLLKVDELISGTDDPVEKKYYQKIDVILEKHLREEFDKGTYHINNLEKLKYACGRGIYALWISSSIPLKIGMSAVNKRKFDRHIKRHLILLVWRRWRKCALITLLL